MVVGLRGGVLMAGILLLAMALCPGIASGDETVPGGTPRPVRSILLLSVGESSYPGKAALPGAARDAREVARRFLQLGVTEPVELKLPGNEVGDGYNVDVDRFGFEALVTALESRLTERSSRYDLVVLYYAGHGIQGWGSGSLSPHLVLLRGSGTGRRLGEVSGAGGERAVREAGLVRYREAGVLGRSPVVSLEAIQRRLESLGGRWKLLLIYDACRTPGVNENVGVWRPGGDGRTAVLLASTAGEYAFGGRDGGKMTRVLVERMRHMGVGQVVGLRELLEGVVRRFPAGTVQHPVLYGGAALAGLGLRVMPESAAGVALETPGELERRARRERRDELLKELRGILEASRELYESGSYRAGWRKSVEGLESFRGLFGLEGTTEEEREELVRDLDAYELLSGLGHVALNSLSQLQVACVRGGEGDYEEELKGRGHLLMLVAWGRKMGYPVSGEFERGLAELDGRCWAQAQERRVQEARRARVRRLLSRAEAYLRQRALTTPAGANALELYRQVLELEPGNAQARTGLERIVSVYAELFGSRLSRGELSLAEEYLERARMVLPSSEKISKMERELAEEKDVRMRQRTEERAKAELAHAREAALQGNVEATRRHLYAAEALGASIPTPEERRRILELAKSNTKPKVPDHRLDKDTMSINDKVLSLVDVGMTEKEVFQLLGRPTYSTVTTMWTWIQGHKYGRYWIITKSGVVDCIVDQRGYVDASAISHMIASCERHIKKNPQYVIKR